MLKILMSRRLLAGTCVAVALMLGACGDDAPQSAASAGEGTGPASEPTQAGGPPRTAEEIVDRAKGAAESFGEPEPTEIEWVSTTRAAANAAISGSTVGAGAEDVDVLVIQAQGDFVVSGQGGPPDEEGNAAPPPTGKAFTLVIDSRTGQTLDIGVQPEAMDLAQLGSVEQEPA